MPKIRGGFILAHVLFVVLVVGTWATMVMTFTVRTMRDAAAAEDVLGARVALEKGLDVAMRTPDLPLLCLSGPLAAYQVTQGADGGGHVQIRWRHVSDGLMIAEVEAVGPRGARVRRVGWLVADSVDRTETGVRCAGSGLHPIGGIVFMAHPGE